MGFWGKLAGLGAMAGGGLALATGVGAPIGLGLIGAGAGLTKHEFEDLPQEEKQNELAAATAQYRPLTGLTPKEVQHSSGVGSALSGGVTGAMLGQSLASLPAAAPSTAGLGTGLGTMGGTGTVSGLNYAQSPSSFFGLGGAAPGVGGSALAGGGIPTLPAANSAMNGYWSQLRRPV